MNYLVNRSSSSSSSGSNSLEVIEESLSEEEYENEHTGCLESSEVDSVSGKQSSASGGSKGEFRLLLTSRNCQLLNFYRSIVAPYVESYWLTADRLASYMTSTGTAPDSPIIVQEAVFLKDLTAHVQQMLLKGQIHFGM